VNVITVTVMAEDGTVVEYVLEVTVPSAPPGEGLEIGGVWPSLGTPEGGMPATVLGSGFTGATGVLIGGVSVPLTVTGDGRIDFVTPPGVDGTTVDVTIVTPGGSVTLENAFGYAAADMAAFDASTGGVVTTTNGVVIEVPSQGISGTLRITVTPEAPPTEQEGRLLLYSFRAEATLDGQPLGVITNALQMKLAVDSAYMRGGWLPWLWEYTGADDGAQRSAVDSWAQVSGQVYDAVRGEVRANVKTMTHYALTVRYGLKSWYAWIEQR